MKMNPFVLIIGSMLLIAALAVAGCSQAQANTAGNPVPGVSAGTVTQPAVITPAPAATTPVPAATTAPPATTTPPKQEAAVVKIGEIIKQPKQYAGKAVIVQGKIVNECGSGCWFTLKDDTGTIYIDLAPNNMVIPQKRGASAKVSAVVEIDGKDVFLVGSKVDF